MKLKQIISLILILLVGFMVLSGCRNNLKPAFTIPPDYSSTPEPKDEDETREVTPLLYKITDSEGRHLWIFGITPYSRDYYDQLPDYVINALNDSVTLAVEHNVVNFEASQTAQQDALSFLLYKEESISDYISQELYSEAVKIIDENVIYNKGYDNYIPTYWASVIDSFTENNFENISKKNSLESHMINLGRKNGKVIKELDSYKYEYELQSKFSYNLQEFLLQEAVDRYNNKKLAEEKHNLLLDAWEKGDTETLNNLLYYSKYDEAKSPLYKELKEYVFTNRVDFLTEMAESAISSEYIIFFCIDSMYLYGENDLLDVLSEKGYMVEIIKE